MHLTVLGAGYVGLTTEACLARGHGAPMYRVDARRAVALASEGVPCEEPGPDDLVLEDMRERRQRVAVTTARRQ